MAANALLGRAIGAGQATMLGELLGRRRSSLAEPSKGLRLFARFAVIFTGILAVAIGVASLTKAF